MICLRPLLLAAGVLAGAGLPPHGLAAEPPSPRAPAAAANPEKAERADIARAEALLDKAEAFYREKGQRAHAAFSRSGEFQDGELYVYVLDPAGNFLASGGSSVTLIGRNVRNMPDARGKLFFREILDGAKTRRTGLVEYHWLNARSGQIERKTASYRVVDESILVVGYYTSRGTAEQARSLLWAAVHEFKQHGERAFERFNDLNGSFVQEDLYVFVLDMDSQVIRAHGGMPRMIDRPVGELTDATGKPFIREMIQAARARDEGRLEYAWRNPLTQKMERKQTWFVRVGKQIIAVGAYAGPLN
ncbi:cache domain-containing protein [Zoogloea sp.]|uniref:cache domain-containing protein n=1 Tax=Zoogloea sp. TaxID=49181 RepID=UPI001415DFFE|nr:MAG: hypothetical protein F9K15_12595 [Zoogloea sp.]